MTTEELWIVLGALAVAFLIGAVWGYKLARQANKFAKPVEIRTDHAPRPQATIKDLADKIRQERAAEDRQPAHGPKSRI